MFDAVFNNTSTSTIVSDLKSKGYFAFEGAIDEKYVDQLLSEIDFDSISLNCNDVGVVNASNIKFLTHCLASSKPTFDIITSDKVLDICKSYFTDTFNLVNHRVYKTCKSSHMPWHTDNNKQVGGKLSEKHEMPGLLFLFYLSDVDKNAFQFIDGSHKFSRKYSKEVYLSDKYIQNTYKKDILSFYMKKGSLIVSDIHGLHRAEPFTDQKYTRTTLLFQVDQVGDTNSGHGEKNLLNTEYLSKITPDLMSYLGFGFKRTYPPFPNSSLATLPVEEILALQKQLVPKTAVALFKNAVRALLPAESLIYAKRVLWKNRKTE